MTSLNSEPASQSASGPSRDVPPASFAQDLRHVGAGVLMGAADVVPGVSGGTVALILNVYGRLVSAITKANKTLLEHVLRRDFKAAAEHIDFRFVAALGAGIAAGILSLASLMHYLLENHEARTHAVFCGLILASTLIVSRRIVRWNGGTIACFIAGIVVAAWLMGLAALQSPPTGRWYIFLCGMIGICAMILPGISGAFILLVLGKYEYITGQLKGVLQGEITVDSILTILTFCFGCLTGLLAFSRVVKWLLARHHDVTMAILCGFMLGSLRKLWPIREWPIPQNGETVLLLTLFVSATAVVLLIDLWSRIRKLGPEPGVVAK